MTGALFRGNFLVADTSSLIYLARSSIIRPFLRAFHVTIPPLVYQECVQKGYPGSDEIRGLRQEGWLCVHPVREDSALALRLPKGGEREVIILFYQLGPDGILIDDGDGNGFSLWNAAKKVSCKGLLHPENHHGLGDI